MRALRVLMCSAEEMTAVDLLLRDSLKWDPNLQAKVMECPTGPLVFMKEFAPLVRSSREMSA